MSASLVTVIDEAQLEGLNLSQRQKHPSIDFKQLEINGSNRLTISIDGKSAKEITNLRQSIRNQFTNYKKALMGEDSTIDNSLYVSTDLAKTAENKKVVVIGLKTLS